jgi:carbon monoxide dehydrogenase subunit G
VLNSPERMAKLMPGVESFDVTDDTHWRANVKIPLGLGGMRMTFDFTKLEERQPEFAKLHAKGNGVGAIVSMDTAFDLAEADGGGTQMKWQADVKIAGPVGSMGQRVLQPIVNQQVNRRCRRCRRWVGSRAAYGSRGQGRGFARGRPGRAGGHERRGGGRQPMGAGGV